MKIFKYNKFARAIALHTTMLASAGVLATEDAGYINAGAFQLTPKLKTEVAHDDNVLQTKDNTRSSTILTVNPSLEAKAINGLNEYSVLLDVDSNRYASEQELDYTDISATFDVHQEFNSRNRVDFSLFGGKLHDANSLIASGKRPPEYNKQTGNFVYGFGSEQAKAQVEVFGGLEKKDYKEKENNKKDSSTKTLGSTFYYRVMPKTKALVEVKKRAMKYDEKQKNDNNQLVDAGFDVTSYLIGLSWEATAKTSGYTKFGRRSREAEASGIDRETSNAWEVGVSYQPLPYSTIQLSTTHDYGLESDDPLKADFTSGTNTTLSWNHEWSDRIGSRASWNMIREEVQGLGGQSFKDRETDTFSIGMSWKMRRWLTVHADYSREKRDESLKAAGLAADRIANDYSRNIYVVSVEMTL